ncbi:MAG TPA: biotin transporter BioY [Pyrinomonadaceae bacterium]|jgi:biotin transport system substrate-specific component|nr:biotin transporter BioY [Pyrinomonadaceae bacterium]
MSTEVRADTLMGAALAPLDSTRSAGLVIVFSLFIAACAQFSIQIGPVPITGQSFAVLLTGALLGSRMGAAAVIAYLIEGAVGLPFFAPGGAPGLLRFFGSTGGYLVAFPAAAFVTGAFAEHGWDKRYPTAVAAMAIGSAIVFLGGWAWFSVLTHTPPLAAFKLAVLPFLPGDVIKIALAAAVLPTGWALLKK